MFACRYGENCYRINMNHLQDFEHPVSVYMSRTAVIYDSNTDEFLWKAHCKDREQCTDTSELHLQKYWHAGDDCLDPNEGILKYVSQIKDRKYQTEQDPVNMSDLQILGNSTKTGKELKLLKELALKTVAQAINESPLDYVDYFKDISSEIANSYFPLLTYSTMEKLVEANAFDWLGNEKSYYEHHQNLENRYRSMFVSDRENKALEDPCLMMGSVFIGYETKAFVPKETDTLLLESPFHPGSAFASKELFKKQWHHLTGGVFQDIDLNNLFFAGGAVLAALQPFDPSKDINEQLIEKGYYNSDIDIFVYGISDPEEATERVQKFCEDIQTQVDDVLFVRNHNTLTIVREYPLRQIQVIFRLYKSPSEILMGFDIDCCCVGYDGNDVYGIPRFFGAVTYQRNVVDLSRRSPSYEYRLYKYSKRGFGVLIKDRKIDIEEIDMDVDELYGLPKLVDLSEGGATELHRRYKGGKIPKASSSESPSEEAARIQQELKIAKVKKECIDCDEYIKMVSGQPFEIRNKRHKGGLLPDSRVTEIIDIDRYVESNSFAYSNYMTIKIPYSANWSLARIEELIVNVNKKFLNCQTYGTLQFLSFATAQMDDNEDISDIFIPDCIEIARFSEDVFESNLSFVAVIDGRECISEYSPDECWLIDNPGQQMLTGSFEPIQSEIDDWITGKSPYDEDE
ncbi:Protein mono-ADP-ribosyltransferase parp4 [Boothiomyces macroporosus]|uniref:Protein mono-ADP-ribosyltransferase parp4 n=1 Tax=Boothiomyces macroporosus TaxID=261099 RepID=A0AAD5UCM6_9FUNG|nr:Protein mono-ADP-ribosyltransferase parp4 [Boothiomyces macroporosus]